MLNSSSLKSITGVLVGCLVTPSGNLNAVPGGAIAFAKIPPFLAGGTEGAGDGLRGEDAATCSSEGLRPRGDKTCVLRSRI